MCSLHGVIISTCTCETVHHLPNSALSKDLTKLPQPSEQALNPAAAAAVAPMPAVAAA